MSEVQPRKTKPDLLQWAIRGAALIGVAAVLYVIVQATIKPDAEADLRGLRRGAMARLVVPPAPKPGPDVGFTDGAGAPLTVADFKGRVVVVNLWATWCGPCKTEMPTLAALQAAYQTQPVSVLPLSADRDSELALAGAFIGRHPPLKLYRDKGFRFAYGLDPRVEGFPTTIIFDRQGRERARFSGDADWNSKDARAVIEALLRE
ncbi:MAG: TlpA family protein disulfide reductase [Pseudomonadota bacterium]